jgi:hypothetical protein
MGPQGQDPMFPARLDMSRVNPASIDPGRQQLGQQFQPVGAPQPGMMPQQQQQQPQLGQQFRPIQMPPQAQGTPYGVPFVGLGNPWNPAGRPASPRAAQGLAQALSRPFGTRRQMGGGGTGRDGGGIGGGRSGGSQFSGRDRSNFGH